MGTQIRAFAAHALWFGGLAVAHSLAGHGALVSDPAFALRLLVVCEAPLVIVVFSLLRLDPKRCSFLEAAGRGLLGLPIGALLKAFGALVLGAPAGIKYWTATIYWSLLMSALHVCSRGMCLWSFQSRLAECALVFHLLDII